MQKKRDYKKEYKRDHSFRADKVDRASRNKVRRQALKAGKVKKGDSKEVHHVDGNPRNNSQKNLKVVKRSTNRSKK